MPGMPATPRMTWTDPWWTAESCKWCLLRSDARRPMRCVAVSLRLVVVAGPGLGLPVVAPAGPGPDQGVVVATARVVGTGIAIAVGILAPSHATGLRAEGVTRRGVAGTRTPSVSPRRGPSPPHPGPSHPLRPRPHPPTRNLGLGQTLGSGGRGVAPLLGRTRSVRGCGA